MKFFFTVTVDFLKSPKADTGEFDLIYEMRLPEKRYSQKDDSEDSD